MSVIFLSGSCIPAQGFDNRLKSIVRPHRFSIAKWELKTIPYEVNQWVFGSPKKVDDEVGTVTEYFRLIERIKTLKSEIDAINAGKGQGDLASLEAELSKLQEQRADLDETVEGILGKQIKGILAQQGIFNPILKSEFSFPPLIFKLEKPPRLLVVSPRERIETIRRVPLQPGISLEETEAIEAEVDKLGVSSLVVELGGFATYPSLVTSDASLRFIIDTVTEEWLHQYLAFTPLGIRYLLDVAGLARNYEIAVMNETLAGMVGKEIGTMVCGKYYAECENQRKPVAKPGFDFNREMREIRRAVDQYLARGEIEQAEEFMEQKRQYLASKGYYIRKLNQAYFAFYGAYADMPTSISPIGVELKELRRQSTSLKDFLDTVAVMTSRQDLKAALKSGELEE
jgi:predicted  nucleic acid-binding Zn-ribbon protein